MSLGCGLPGGRPCETRAKRLEFAWSREAGSGQAFKVRGCGDDIDILFRGNVVMMETGINSAGSNLPFFQCMHVQPGSTDNTFFWLGGCDFRGLEMVQLHGACVPARFDLDPAVRTHASNSRAAWEAHVAPRCGTPPSRTPSLSRNQIQTPSRNLTRSPRQIPSRNQVTRWSRWTSGRSSARTGYAPARTPTCRW